MKIAMVFDTAKGREISEAVKSLLPNCEFALFDTQEHPILGCVGCFGCWIKTPGLCALKSSDNTFYLKEVYDADYILYISKITFGGYSSSIKAYLDRSIPLSHPYFVSRNHETHHKLRYKSMPKVFSIGYDAINQKEEEVFEGFLSANLANTSKKMKKIQNSFIWKNNKDELSKWITETLN